MNKLKTTLLTCGLLTGLSAGAISVYQRGVQQRAIQQKTLEVKLGAYQIDTLPKSTDNGIRIAAAQRLAKEILAHPQKEIFIVTWGKYSDDFSYAVEAKYDRSARTLTINRRETSVYTPEGK